MATKRARAEKTTAKGGTLKIRPLAPGDLDAIVAIDRAVSGRARHAFYAKRLAHYEHEPDAFMALAAVLDGRLVGFAFARLYEGEFGHKEPEAALDAIGVDANARGHGIGRELLDGLAAAMRIHGVRELATQVDWTATGLLGFFARMKFTLAPRIVLERSVNAPVAG